MELLTTKQILEAVRELTESLGRPPTFRDLESFFNLKSPSHARYYVRKAEEAGAVVVDDRRSPYWIEAAR